MKPTTVADNSAETVEGRLAALGLAMLIGTAVTLILGVQPILLGGLAHAGRMSDRDIGGVATAEILALALGSGIGPRLLPLFGMRTLTLLGCVALAAIDLAVSRCASPGALYLDRFGAGLAEGIGLSATIYILVHDRAADRVNGFFLAASTIPQMIAAFLLPTLVIPKAGVDAGFAILAAAAGAAALVGVFLKGRPQGDAEAVVSPIRWTPGLIAGLAAIFIHGAGIGGAWNYIEALATEHQLASAAIAVALAGSLGCQILGGFAVAWFGWRTPFSIALILGSILQAVIVIGLMSSRSGASFIPLAWTFGFFWLALAPFQLQLILRLDPERSAALLLTPLSLIGFSAGPMIASLFVRPAHVGGGFVAASAMLLLAAALYAVIRTSMSKKAAGSVMLR